LQSGPGPLACLSVGANGAGVHPGTSSTGESYGYLWRFVGPAKALLHGSASEPFGWARIDQQRWPLTLAGPFIHLRLKRVIHSGQWPFPAKSMTAGNFFPRIKRDRRKTDHG
jgi:hypothetical protein